MGYAFDGVPAHELPDSEILAGWLMNARIRDSSMTYAERYASICAKDEIKREKARMNPKYKRVKDLRPGDECQFKKETDILVSVTLDDDGYWVEWESGDCGYVSDSTMFNVIDEWNW